MDSFRPFALTVIVCYLSLDDRKCRDATVTTVFNLIRSGCSATTGASIGLLRGTRTYRSTFYGTIVITCMSRCGTNSVIDDLAASTQQDLSKLTKSRCLSFQTADLILDGYRQDVVKRVSA
jgi:hypothetical protein